MPGINSILDIAQRALEVQQNGLEVTSHNIANVNTPGYSVQRAILQANEPVPVDVGLMGTGVETLEIQRAYSQFLNEQLIDKHAQTSRWQAEKQVLAVLESRFNETEGPGLNQLLDDFWNSWEELSNNPGGMAERTTLIARARSLAEAMNNAALHLDSVKDDLDFTISNACTEVNRYVDQLAELNEKIVANESQYGHANDLRDQRDLILEKLSELVPVSSLESEQGTLSVFLPGGYTLVEGTSSWHLSTALDGNNRQRLLYNGDTDITDSVSAGKIGGWLEVRDELIPKYEETLDGLAAHLANMVNELHRLGVDLEGNDGIDFFTYTPTFGSLPDAGTSDSVNITTEFYDSASNTVGLYNPAEVSGDRYHVQFNMNGGVMEISISNFSTGALVVAAQPYVSGTSYDFDGLRVTIADKGSGPRNGEGFVLLANRDLASNLRVRPELAADARMVAAARPAGSEPFAPGDNRNALAIAELRNQQTMICRQQGTLGEIFRSGLVAAVGNDSALASSRHKYSEGLQQQLTSMRDSVAGVSLDEEMTNIIKYQHAYIAAAKLIGVTDEMLQTLLNTKT
ncbi:MAG: flagellar hook-associated protein FlgK [Deltaproteobacteria bacterium]|nr:flagellar hook-associated protein FlgK [Deltaproteobacteria bacterium]MBW2069698.1 flagellar hook-associated protein FlgK [Deltaproteobacteria bacterium]